MQSKKRVVMNKENQEHLRKNNEELTYKEQTNVHVRYFFISCTFHCVIGLLLLLSHKNKLLFQEQTTASVLFLDKKKERATLLAPQEKRSMPAQKKNLSQKKQSLQPDEPEDLSRYVPIATIKGDPHKPRNTTQFPTPPDQNVSSLSPQKQPNPQPQEMPFQDPLSLHEERTSPPPPDLTPAAHKNHTPTLYASASSLPLEEQIATTLAVEQQQTPSDKHSLRKKKLTLADVFQKLPHHLVAHTDNTGHGHPLGSDQGINTGDTLIIAQTDFRFYSFFSHVLKHLNGTFQFHKDHVKAEWITNHNLHIDIIIDKKGYIQNCIIVQSSGNKELDEFLKKITYESSPLPPVPSNLIHKTFRLKLIWGSVTY